MSILKEAILDGALVGVSIPAIVKVHDIVQATKKSHGTVMRWDSVIIKKNLYSNVRGSITVGIVAAVAFATASWISRTTSPDQSVSTSRSD